LGFRHRDYLAEIRKLLTDMGIAINVVAPQSATPADLARLADADFNVVLYPEIARLSAQWLERSYGQPFSKTIPIGVGARVYLNPNTALRVELRDNLMVENRVQSGTWAFKQNAAFSVGLAFFGPAKK
jgi:hypothetical protein